MKLTSDFSCFLKQSATKTTSKILSALGFVMLLMLSAPVDAIEIDNGVPTGTNGRMTVDVLKAGDTRTVNLTGVNQSGTQVTSDMVYDYFTYISTSNIANRQRLSGIGSSTGPTQSGDNIISSGSFTGSAGNTINWTSTSFIPAGSKTYTTVYTFTAATGTLGTLKFFEYFDSDVAGSNDDVLFVEGDVVNNTLRLNTIDNSITDSLQGIGQTGDYNSTNATFTGWGACTYNGDNVTAVTNSVDPLSTSAGLNSGSCSGLASGNTHPIAGVVRGPNDIVSILAWDAVSTATSMTITTSLSGFTNISLPDANDDSVETFEGQAVVIPVIGNDVVFNTPYTLSTSGVSNGSTTVDNANGTITFTPAAGYSGTTSFTYTLTDSNSATDTATVTVTVIDNIAPTIVSVVRKTPSSEVTNADSLVFTVTFSESVTGVDAADFITTGTALASQVDATNVTGSGSTYDVTVSDAAIANANGTLGLAVEMSGTSIQDGASNALDATAPSGTNNQTYILDNTVPATPTVSSVTANSTTPTLSGTAEAGSTVTVVVGGATYQVTADGSGNWSVDTATATPTSGSLSLVDGNTYDVAVTSVDGAGNSASDTTSNELVIDTSAIPLQVIQDYAADSSNPAPTTTTYSDTGVTGVTATNLAAINDAIDNQAGADGSTGNVDDAGNVDTTAKVQAIVDAYNAILAEADGDAGNDTTATDPAADDYATIGADIGDAANDPENLGLLNDIIDGKDTTAVDTIAEIKALARIANAIQTTAAGGTPSPALTAADLAAIGVTGVTADNLVDVIAAIAASADDGTGTDTVAELQALVNNVVNTIDVSIVSVVDADGDRKPEATGTATPGAQVVVTWPDGTSSSTQADASGQWSVESTTAQSSGSVSALATNSSGTPATAAGSYTAAQVSGPIFCDGFEDQAQTCAATP